MKNKKKHDFFHFILNPFFSLLIKIIVLDGKSLVKHLSKRFRDFSKRGDVRESESDLTLLDFELNVVLCCVKSIISFNLKHKIQFTFLNLFILTIILTYLILNNLNRRTFGMLTPVGNLTTKKLISKPRV